MSYSLNCSKMVILGSIVGIVKADTRRLDNES